MTNKPFIKIPIIASAVLLTLASCTSDKKEELTSGILLKNMDTLVKPGNDFDAYVNGGWLKKNEIPADKSSYGVAEVLDDEAQANVKKIIEESAKGDFADGSNEQKIGDFYNAYMDQKARDAKGISPIKPELASIDAIKTYDDLATFFGKLTRSGGTTPFAVGVTEDFKDPTKYMLYTW